MLHSISLSSLSYRFAFRSFDMMACFTGAVCQGARVTRHDGIVQQDGYLLATVVVVEWPDGNIEKFKDDDFCDVEM
jgi:hypothetical protein